MVFVQDYIGSLRVSGNQSDPATYGDGLLTIEGSLTVGGSIEFGLGTNIIDPTNDKFFILGEFNELAPGVTNVLINGNNNVISESYNNIFGDFIEISTGSMGNLVGGTNISIGTIGNSLYNLIHGQDIVLTEGSYNFLVGNNITIEGSNNFLFGKDLIFDLSGVSNENYIFGAFDVEIEALAAGSSNNYIFGIGSDGDQLNEIKIQDLTNESFIFGNKIYNNTAVNNAIIISPKPINGGLYQGSILNSVHAVASDTLTMVAENGIFMDGGSGGIETDLINYNLLVTTGTFNNINDVPSKALVDLQANRVPVFIPVGPLETYTTIYDAVTAGFSNILVIGNTNEPDLTINIDTIQRSLYIVIQANVIVNYNPSVDIFRYLVDDGIIYQITFEGPGTLNWSNTAVNRFIFSGTGLVGGIDLSLIGLNINITTNFGTSLAFIRINQTYRIIDTVVNFVKNTNQNVDLFNIVNDTNTTNRIGPFIENLTINLNYAIGAGPGTNSLDIIGINVVRNGCYINNIKITGNVVNLNVPINIINYQLSFGTTTPAVYISNIYNNLIHNDDVFYRFLNEDVGIYQDIFISLKNIYNIGSATRLDWKISAASTIIVSESLFGSIQQDTDGPPGYDLGQVKIFDTIVDDIIDLNMTSSNLISNLMINSCIAANGIFVRGGPGSDNNSLIIKNNIVTNGEINLDVSGNSITVVTFDTPGATNYIVPANVVEIGYQVIGGGPGAGGSGGGGGMGYELADGNNDASGGGGGTGARGQASPIITGFVDGTELAAGTNFAINIGASGSNGIDGNGFGTSSNTEGSGATGTNGLNGGNGNSGTSSTLVGPVTNVVGPSGAPGGGGSGGTGGTEGISAGVGGVGGVNAGNPALNGGSGGNGALGFQPLGGAFGSFTTSPNSNGTPYGRGGVIRNVKQFGGGGWSSGSIHEPNDGTSSIIFLQQTNGAVILNVEQLTNQFRNIIVSDNFCNGINIISTTSLTNTKILNNNILGTTLSNIGAKGIMERCIISNNIWNSGTLIVGNNNTDYDINDTIIDSNIFSSIIVYKGGGTNNIYTNNIATTSSSFPDGVLTVNANNIP